MKEKVLNISKKNFINVILILSFVIIFTGIVVSIIPTGHFNDEGVYILGSRSMYKIHKILLAPFFFLKSDGLISFIMLSLFIMIITGSFQVMNDSNGMKVVLKKLVIKFENKPKILISIITLFFMIFGSVYGVFEETVILIPLIVYLSLSLKYDTLTGLAMSLLAVGLGFGCATLNPFTIGIASNLAGINPLSGIMYRVLIFIITYFILLSFIFNHIKKIMKDKTSSISYYVDKDKIAKQDIKEFTCQNEQRILKIYLSFFIGVLIAIVLAYSIKQIRDYSVVILSLYMLIFGILSGYLVFKNIKVTLKSFLNGLLSALPAVLLILLALSVNFIITDANVVDTITYNLLKVLENVGTIKGVILIFFIVLFLEFFISSSTAKAMLVISILAPLTIHGQNTNLTPEILVLAYTMGDGFTNVIFITSPVLLITLGMCDLKYRDWLKWTKWLFLLIFVLNIIYLIIGVLIGY